MVVYVHFLPNGRKEKERGKQEKGILKESKK